MNGPRRLGATSVTVCAAALLCGTGAVAGMFPHAPFSAKSAGSTSASFLKFPAGARSEALNGTVSVAVSGAEALFWNPAGLARLEGQARTEAAASHNLLLQGASLSSLSFAHPGRTRGVFGAGLVYYTPGSMNGYTPLGDPDGTFTPYDLAFIGGWAKSFPLCRVGAAAKVIRSDFPDGSATAGAFDLGVQADRVADLGERSLPFGVGFSARHLGLPVRAGAGTDPLPMKLQGGLSVQVSPHVSLMADGHLPVDQDPYATLGMEVILPFASSGGAALRTGYRLNRKRSIDGFASATFGFGLDFSRLMLDYAWVPFGTLGSTNRISVGARF